MSQVPELFRRAGALASLRPAAVQQQVAAHQQQLSAQDDPPQLLQQLHACLHETIQGITREAASQDGSAAKADIATKQKTSRQLFTYQQAFQLFLASMTTYRPLLLRIKQAYDEALRDATASSCDNAYLQSKLSLMPHQLADAVAAARHEAEQQAKDMEAELSAKLAQLEQQAEQVEMQSKQTEDQLHHMQKHMLQARRELDQLDVSNRRAYKDLIDNSSWKLLTDLMTRPA